MKVDDLIYVAGSNGMVGSAIIRALRADGYENILTRTSRELDLRDQSAVRQFFESERPTYVFLAAAKVGGILANNTYRGEFLHDNLAIQMNVIESARLTGVTKLMFLGSSCIYPKMAPQPLKEDYLLTGLLEPTNEPYAIAKISGIKMCEAYRDQYGCNFISVMPTNLYGPNDNFDLKNSHVLPALIRKFYTAKAEDRESVEIWGTGSPKREFMHVDDLAQACLFLMKSYDGRDFLNVGTGEDISIKELAEMVGRIVGFDGELRFDTTKPDGTPRKLMDIGRLNALGWKAQISLEDGIRGVVEDIVTGKIVFG
jgi:GDP-L-fucose synthase